jgi:hypothetical protein
MIPSSIYIAILLSIVESILMVVFAIISYPANDFGKMDISGKNFIAYKYKAFLNNPINTKVVQISDI